MDKEQLIDRLLANIESTHNIGASGMTMELSLSDACVLADALARAERATQPAQEQVDAALESAVQAVMERAGEAETILLVSAFDAIRSLKKDRYAAHNKQDQVAAVRAVQKNPHAATFPVEIWLNVGDGDAHEVGPYKYLSELSWCWESIDKYDVRYVRADLAAAAPSPQPER